MKDSNNQPKKGGFLQGKRHMILLGVNTVFFAVLYFVLPRLGFPYMTHIYLFGGGALALWYVIYNRGFRTKGKTPEMLPDSLPFEERVSMIAEDKKRLDASRWALLVLIPLIVTLLLDMIYLFLIPEGLF